MRRARACSQSDRDAVRPPGKLLLEREREGIKVKVRSWIVVTETLINTTQTNMAKKCRSTHFAASDDKVVVQPWPCEKTSLCRHGPLYSVALGAT